MVAPSHNSPARARSHILVVDDEPMVRELVCRILEAEGFQTLQAADGAAAIGMLATAACPIALVVSDIMMPRLTGVEFEREVAARWPRLPVLLISGGMTDVVLARSLHTRAPILPKPFSRERLVGAVCELLNARQDPRQEQRLLAT